MERFDVTWLGKCATFLLMFAVPGFLMGESSAVLAEWYTVAAWCLAIPGLILSYYTAFAYAPKIAAAIRSGRARRS
jgi:cardiolipin synthase